MRPRSQTIGTLGRSPARHSRPQPIVAPPPPSEPPPPERGLLRRWVHGALFDNVGLKFLSLVLAVTVFLLINTDKDREKTVKVGVKYEYPADKVLVSDLLDDVRVTLKGPWRRLRDLRDGDLKPITLDLRNAPTADVGITADLITDLPPGFEVMSINPHSIRVAFDKRVEKLVEVSPVVTGSAKHGYVVAEIKAVPPTVRVRGGERLLAALTSIRTTDVSLDKRTDSFEELAELAAPDGVVIDPTQRIGVHVRIVEELVTRKVPDLAVTVGGDGVDPAKWSIAPAQIEVTLTGPLLDIESAKRDMKATVKLTPTESRPREAKVVLEGVKDGVGVRISPERVKVTPVKATAPP